MAIEMQNAQIIRLNGQFFCWTLFIDMHGDA